MSWEQLAQWGLGPVCTLLAGYIGVKYGLKQVKMEKRLDFIEKQLREFYSPMVGFRKEIRAKSELRVKIDAAASEAWAEHCKKYSGNPTFEAVVDEEAFEKYGKIIEYNNEQLEDVLLPLYRQMLSTFRDHYWLSEPETRGWFSELSDFVEIWDRWMAKTIPSAVVRKLDHSEKRLHSFYQELEIRMDILRARLPA